MADIAPLTLWMTVGIVNLTAENPRYGMSGKHRSCPGDFRPQAHRCCSLFAMMAGGNVLARDVKQVGDRITDGDETL